MPTRNAAKRLLLPENGARAGPGGKRLRPGQPKETRAKAGIRAGDKLALVGWRKGDRVCCLSLIKVEEMTEMVGDLLNSLMASAPESEK